jgi:WD40 repeat protein
VAFSPDGLQLARPTRDGLVHIYHVHSGRHLGRLKGHTDVVWDVAYSPSDPLVATASSDGTVGLWRSDSQELIKRLQGHSRSVGSVAFSPTGQLLASAGADGAVRVWTKDGQPHLEARGSWGWIRGVAFSSNGEQLATACDDGVVRLWRTADMAPEQEFAGHATGVFGVVFVERGDVFLASAGADTSIRLWSEDATPVGKLEGHANRVLGLACSPNRRILASGGADCRVCVWDVHRRDQISVMTDHKDWVRRVLFSPNGDFLATMSDADNEGFLLWKVTDLAPTLAEPATAQ